MYLTRNYKAQTLVFGYALCVIVYCLLYYRTIFWGWLVFDDKALLVLNPHLGHHSWSNVWWALTDTAFGRRWTPISWLVAEIPSKMDAVQYHILVFGEGLLLSVLVLTLFLRHSCFWYALLCALAFVCCPLRNEVFAWSMGFVYATVALCCVAAFLTDRIWLRFVWLWLGMLAYPQAVGVLLVACWVHRGNPWIYVSLAGIVAFAVVQYTLRVHIGFIPMHYRYATLPWVVCHYVLMLFFPFVTTPIFPAGFYPLLYVGGIFAGFWLGMAPRSFFVAIVVLAPVIVASITESFWFGARYFLLFDIACLFCFSRWASGFPGIRPLVLGFGAVMLGGCAVWQDRVLEHGNLPALEQTIKQAQFIGADCLVYKAVLGHLTPDDLREIKKRPALAAVLK